MLKNYSFNLGEETVLVIHVTDVEPEEIGYDIVRLTIVGARNTDNNVELSVYDKQTQQWSLMGGNDFDRMLLSALLMDDEVSLEQGTVLYYYTEVKQVSRVLKDVTPTTLTIENQS